MNFSFYNPVKIIRDKLENIGSLFKGRKTLLVTSPSFVRNGIVDTLVKKYPEIIQVIDDIMPNPDFDHLRKNWIKVYAFSQSFELILAVGGGSVLDSAKVFSVSNSEKKFHFVENLIKGKRAKEDYRLIPMILIPTTAGTGSEVTPWATVWDNREMKKYSLHLPDLWAEACFLDPELTFNLPLPVTLSTGLDALSHALESLWNKNRNPVSTLYAVTASQKILDTLPKLIENPLSLPLREKMLDASLKAGLAFSNTQTALAHAVSYDLTIRFGIPHGTACSFTLPDIIDSVSGQDREIDQALFQIFKEKGSSSIRNFFKKLGVSTCWKDYGLTQKDMQETKESLKTVSRAGNSLVDSEKFFKIIEKQFNI
ncbi:MAG TPA: alcohol dehydrogenase [Spirochaetia bacterium]|nr:MAG: hypothetical protein A2Y41_12245 [Spirochaetes bacterium GWB1_36_13]HCL56824.1 alcohol dehydrogenase [Spirochaetia bacterium]